MVASNRWAAAGTLSAMAQSPRARPIHEKWRFMVLILHRFPGKFESIFGEIFDENRMKVLSLSRY
jgi:hypothetical protein